MSVHKKLKTPHLGADDSGTPVMTRLTRLIPKEGKAYWVWNTGLFLVMGLGLALLSLLLAFGHYSWGIPFGYFTHPQILLLNLIPVWVVLLFFWFLTGRTWLAFFITAVMLFGLSIGDYFKLLFRDDPLMFEDLVDWREGKAMAGKYHISLDSRLIFFLAAVLVAILILYFLGKGKPTLPWRLVGPVAVAALAVLLFNTVYLNDNLYNNKTQNYEHINRWSATQQYISRGLVYPFLHSVRSAFDKPPTGYDEESASALLSSYQDADIPADKQVNLICIQREAFADFSGYGIEGLSDSVYAQYHDLEKESYTGDLVTDIFAGGTTETEWAMLTGGDRHGSFRKETNSYAWYLKNQGYTVTGAHPSYEWFYNRLNVNANLGFSNYLFLENHFGALAEGGIAGDDIFFPELANLFKEHFASSDQPYFSFNVTYQGHGPYDKEETEWGDQYVTGNYSKESLNIMNNYFGAVENTNKDLADLVDYFRTCGKPVVLVVWGDHKPWFGDGNSVYHELGINLDVSTSEGFHNYYDTRYLIWANDEAKKILGNDFVGQGPDLSPCFLMEKVFDLCSWKGPAYMQAVRDNKGDLTVTQLMGPCQDGDTFVASPSAEEKTTIQLLQDLSYYNRTHFGYGG